MRIIIFLIPNKALSGRERRLGKGKVESRRWGGEDRKGGAVMSYICFFLLRSREGGLERKDGRDGVGANSLLLFCFRFLTSSLPPSRVPRMERWTGALSFPCLFSSILLSKNRKMRKERWECERKGTGWGREKERQDHVRYLFFFFDIFLFVAASSSYFLAGGFSLPTCSPFAPGVARCLSNLA